MLILKTSIWACSDFESAAGLGFHHDTSKWSMDPKTYGFLWFFSKGFRSNWKAGSIEKVSIQSASQALLFSLNYEGEEKKVIFGSNKSSINHNECLSIHYRIEQFKGVLREYLAQAAFLNWAQQHKVGCQSFILKIVNFRLH